MKQIAVVGAVFGDEAKARIVHKFAPQYDWVIRYSGSSNAGHTIYRDGKKYVHNLLPSADYRIPTTKSFLGAGMVIHIEDLLKEVVHAEENYPGIAKTIFIDPDAFIISDLHREVDRQKNKHIGTTGKGVGPAYVEKMSRSGVRLIQYIKDNHPAIQKLKQLGVNFTHVHQLFDQLKQSSLIFEGSQSILLDLNLGTYPYVSCGESGISGIYSSGFGFVKLDRVYGAAKVYSTRVGEGPFPTEIFGQEAEELREKGCEYGATTGRPRRVGWADFAALKYAAEKGGITHLVISKFDILNGMSKVPVAVKYQQPIHSVHDLVDAVPEYVYLDGWQDQQDKNMYKFITLCEKVTGIKVSHVSFGTSSKDLIEL
jgi:adenylosuccinate synthase